MATSLWYLVGSSGRHELRRKATSSYLRLPISTITTATQSQHQLLTKQSTEYRHTSPLLSLSSTFSTTTELKTIEDYKEQKQQAKQRRTDLYNKSQDRKKRLATRRDPYVAKHDRNKFHAFFDPLKSKQEFLDRKARRENLHWKINVKVMIERLPIMMPALEKWEKDYYDLKEYLARFEPAYPEELGFEDPMKVALAADKKKSKTPEKDESDLLITEADKSGDIQTIERKLDRRIYLAVRENDQDGWSLPTVSLNTDETLLDAGKRATKQYAGDRLDIVCLGFGPMGVRMVEYDEDKKGEYFGDKNFYFKVQVVDGDVEKDAMKGYDDWGWLDRSEITERVKDDQGEEVGQFYHYLL